jgi:pSer/pThr/pTyr-binding forkhead associated (FHA) protein
MNICPFCERNNREGAMICDHCGRSMSIFAGLATRVMDEDRTTDSLRRRGGDQFAPDTVAVIHIEHMEQPIVLTVNDPTILGRGSIDRGRNPDIDLTMYNAFAQGVSSRHAGLQRHGTQLTLTDLASTNGTYLNGERLEEYQPVTLHDGDEIRLGRLKIALYFESSVSASF